nr:membrane protein insertase YidC [Desulfobacula sp.]
MDEQKRLILAVVLSVLVLVGYQAFFVKPPEPGSLPQEVQTQGEVQSKDQGSAPAVSEYTAKTDASPEAVEVQKTNYRTLVVSTPLYNISVSEAGAVVQSFELKNYSQTNEKDSPLKQLVPQGLGQGIFSLDLEGRSIPGLKNAVYAADTDATEINVSQGEKTLEFVFETLQGIIVKKIFTFRADSYLIDCDIVFQNGSDTPLNDAVEISIPGIYNKEVEDRSKFAFEGPSAFVSNEYTEIKPDDIEEKNTYTGKIGWAGYSERYFFTALMPKTKEGGVPADAKLFLTYANDKVVNHYIRKMEPLDKGRQSVYSFAVYMGPKSHKVLSKYDNNLKEAVNFGFFNVIAKPLLIGMNFIHDLIPNYGVAIILLTVIIKLVFWPLGTKSYKSMNEMKKIQPLMMELREKYKDDKQRMNQEVMGLYKTYKVNPASGCLPMLVQMPIFFALYRMLYQAIELRHAPFLGWITDLAAPERLFHFNFSIPFMDAPYGIPVLTLLMGASFLLQQKMTPTGGDPMQAKMMMLMPLIMTVLFINFPAGLVLYMVVNNIISMGQQYYIQKKLA